MIDALIGLDRESYTVNEADGSVTVCVLFLMNSGVQDPTLSVEATLSVADGTAIGIVTLISVYYVCHVSVIFSVQLLKTMANHYRQTLN